VPARRRAGDCATLIVVQGSATGVRGTLRSVRDFNGSPYIERCAGLQRESVYAEKRAGLQWESVARREVCGAPNRESVARCEACRASMGVRSISKGVQGFNGSQRTLKGVRGFNGSPWRAERCAGLRNGSPWHAERCVRYLEDRSPPAGGASKTEAGGALNKRAVLRVPLAVR